MLWRSIIALWSVTFLNGCGFEPLYAPMTRASVQDLGVKIDPIPDREGQLMRNALFALFQPHGLVVNPAYQLKTKISFDQADLGFRRDETASRTRITATTEFQLINLQTQKVIHKGKLKATTAYTVGPQVTSAALPLIVSEKDSKKRLVQQLATDIHRDIATYVLTQENTALIQ